MASDDEYGWGGEKKYYLWNNIDNVKYIRKNVRVNQNLSSSSSSSSSSGCATRGGDLQIISNSTIDHQIYYPLENLKGNDGGGCPLNDNRLFTDNYKYLIKSIYCMKQTTNAAANVILFLSNIFNLCNVVALDLYQNIIIIIYNQKVYIVFYEKQNKYIQLDFTIGQNNKNIAFEIEQFIRKENGAALIYNYYKPSILSYLWSNYFVSPPLECNVAAATNNNIDIRKQWSNWDTISTFLSLKILEKSKYCRKFVHFRFNLKDIYLLEEKEEENYPSLASVCQNLAMFGPLYMYDKALIFNNIIYIDFDKNIFITLNIATDKCIFSIFNFFQKNEPQSSFIFNVPHEKLDFYEFASFISINKYC